MHRQVRDSSRPSAVGGECASPWLAQRLLGEAVCRASGLQVSLLGTEGLGRIMMMVGRMATRE